MFEFLDSCPSPAFSWTCLDVSVEDDARYTLASETSPKKNIDSKYRFSLSADSPCQPLNSHHLFVVSSGHLIVSFSGRGRRCLVESGAPLYGLGSAAGRVSPGSPGDSGRGPGLSQAAVGHGKAHGAENPGGRSLRTNPFVTNFSVRFGQEFFRVESGPEMRFWGEWNRCGILALRWVRGKQSEGDALHPDGTGSLPGESIG